MRVKRDIHINIIQLLQVTQL